MRYSPNECFNFGKADYHCKNRPSAERKGGRQRVCSILRASDIEKRQWNLKQMGLNHEQRKQEYRDAQAGFRSRRAGYTNYFETSVEKGKKTLKDHFSFTKNSCNKIESMRLNFDFFERTPRAPMPHQGKIISAKCRCRWHHSCSHSEGDLRTDKPAQHFDRIELAQHSIVCGAHQSGMRFKFEIFVESNNDSTA